MRCGRIHLWSDMAHLLSGKKKHIGCLIEMKKVPVRDIVPHEEMTVDELIHAMYDAAGFSAKKVAMGVDILERMFSDESCTRFLSFPACICSTGTRGVIRELIKRKLVDVVITTTGMLDHDLARLWRDYLHGSFAADDRLLHQKDIYRLGNVFIPVECYGPILEEKLQPMLKALGEKKKRWSTKDLIWEIGAFLEDEENKEDSIIYWAYKNKIPIYVPGITDGAVGSQLWMYYQENREFCIDLFADEQDLCDLTWDEDSKTGALIIGGGISKHHTIWWNQFKGGLNYVLYVTTAVEYDGSLSGAQTREAISWGKITEDADELTIEGDATVLLPLMVSAVLGRLKK